MKDILAELGTRGTIRAIITLVLLALSGAAMFIPVVDTEVKAMILLLTGISVRDYFESSRADDRAAEPKMPDVVVVNQDPDDAR